MPEGKAKLSLILAVASLATMGASNPSQVEPASAARQPLGTSDVSLAEARIEEWKRLTSSSGHSFFTYARFVKENPGWPGEGTLRAAAERAIDLNTSPPADLIAFFERYPPRTDNGRAALALSLLALGRPDEGAEVAKAGWRSGAFAAGQESRLLVTFGPRFAPADHDRRIEALIASRDVEGARRMLPLASASRRASYEAQLALQLNMADAQERFAPISGSVTTDPGLLLERVEWLQRRGDKEGARALLAQPRTLDRAPANPQRWIALLLASAQSAATEGKAELAYRIASQIEDAYPAGQSLKDRPLKERDDYTSLAWLAATTALDTLSRPAEAARLFAAYAVAGRSAQVLTKGYYWAGRAAVAAGQPEEARLHFDKGSVHPELFYSQLCLERLGKSVPSPPLMLSAPRDEDRAAFNQRSVVKVIRILGQKGDWPTQTQFVRALAESVASDLERDLAAELAAQISRPDLAVWVARNARNDGNPFYARSTYPIVQIPPAQHRNWALAHAIIRQESSFDPRAISPVGARGMMQLMLPTARETAAKLALPYDQGRLLSEPSFNISLGTYYFQSLLDFWGNNAALAAASYNAGMGNVIKWTRDNGDPRLPGADIVKWIEKIPFSETRGYVQRVLENAVVYDRMNRAEALSDTRPPLSSYLGKSRPG